MPLHVPNRPTNHLSALYPTHLLSANHSSTRPMQACHSCIYNYTSYKPAIMDTLGSMGGMVHTPTRVGPLNECEFVEPTPIMYIPLVQRAYCSFHLLLDFSQCLSQLQTLPVVYIDSLLWALWLGMIVELVNLWDSPCPLLWLLHGLDSELFLYINFGSSPPGLSDFLVGLCLALVSYLTFWQDSALYAS